MGLFFYVMTIFNKLYLYIFSVYKDKYKQNANSIALVYISILQISLVFLSGVFLAVFLNQMHVRFMTLNKAVTVFVILGIIIHFANWMGYGGKSRKELNAKYAKIVKPKYSIRILLSLPFFAVIFAIILLNSL